MQRDPSQAPALSLLTQIRTEAQTRASQAKAALKPAASGTQPFKNAEARMQSAEQLTGVDNARRQVQAYNEAEGLYKDAGEALLLAARRHEEAAGHLLRAQGFLDSRNFKEADNAIDEALKLEKSDEATTLRKKVDDARRAAGIEVTKKRVDDLFEKSKMANDADAVALLTQALDLDSTRDDIRRERDRRRAPAPPRDSAASRRWGDQGGRADHDYGLCRGLQQRGLRARPATETIFQAIRPGRPIELANRLERQYPGARSTDGQRVVDGSVSVQVREGHASRRRESGSHGGDLATQERGQRMDPRVVEEIPPPLAARS